MDTIDKLFIEATDIKAKKAHTRTTETKKIKVRSSIEVALDTFREAKRLHKNEIEALKNNIKTHKLMIKQAKTCYKIVKLSNKK